MYKYGSTSHSIAFAPPPAGRGRLVGSRNVSRSWCRPSNVQLHDSLLPRAGHLRSLGPPDDVDLGPHAETLEIEAGFDGKPAAWEQTPFVVRLVIVQMGAVAVHLLAETVSGSMQDGGAVTGLLQHLPCG